MPRDVHYVADLFDSASWKVADIRRWFEEESAEAILNITCHNSEEDDDELPKGQFLVNFAYVSDQISRLAYPSCLTSKDWRQFWSLKIQHRLKLVFWKVIVNPLPLRTNLSRFISSEPESAAACPLCHLFLACQFSRVLWREAPRPMNVEAFVNAPFENWVKSLLYCTHGIKCNGLSSCCLLPPLTLSGILVIESFMTWRLRRLM